MTTHVCFLDPGRDFVRVKTGFSWPAFFLGSTWACAKKLWGLMLLMFMVEGALFFLSAAAGARGDGLLGLAWIVLEPAYLFARGRYANAWRRAALLRKGYRVVVVARPAVT